MAKAFGIVTSSPEHKVDGMQDYRPIGAFSFLGRFRVIDFPISNFSNSGINNIQVYITKKPRSLVAHIGTGRHYNINSKRGRIQIIVPNEELVNSIYNTNINALFSNIDYIRRQSKEYVVIAPSCMVFAQNYDELLQQHVKSGADITLLYHKVFDAREGYATCNALTLDGDKVKAVAPNLGDEDNKDMFMEVRSWDHDPAFRTSRSVVERGARLIYLLKTCFNGLYRVNKKNYFNTPFGKIVKPNYCDEPALEACHRFLNEKEVEICCQDYGSLLDEGKIPDNAFVYLDPPYAPLTQTSSFTSYATGGWDDEDQAHLRDFCRELDERGIRFLESNSTAPLCFELYKEFKISTLDAKRYINSVGSKRGAIKELVITNFDN